MSIRRGHIRKIDDHFTITPNEWARDKRLTRRARGLLVELLSHREGWEITTEALVRNGVEGRDAIKTAIRELEGYGYLVRVQTKDSGNRYGGIEYVLLDPDEAADFQSTDFQSTEKPSAGNPPQRRTSLLEDDLSEAKSAPPLREDVELLCNRLRDRIIANGAKAKITDAWRREARLLLDSDGRDLTQALRVIDWCQQDSFWKSNVLSMPKFREKYDQLRLRMPSNAAQPDALRDPKPGLLVDR